MTSEHSEKKDGVDSQGFARRYRYPERKPPVRAYLHHTGIDVFEDKVGTYAVNAELYILDILDILKEEIRDAKVAYILGFMWGDESANEKIAEIFGFSGLEKWLSNPEVHAWVMREQTLAKNPIACGDTLIFLGEEEHFRRTETKSLEEYMTKHPHVGKMSDKLYLNPFYHVYGLAWKSTDMDGPVPPEVIDKALADELYEKE